MELDLYTNAPADEVRAGDHIVLRNGTHQVDEVRHLLHGPQVVLYSRLLDADPDSKRTVTEYRPMDQVQVVPAGAAAASVWGALRRAVEHASDWWTDTQADDTGNGATPEPPWQVVRDTVRLRAAGRTWVLAPSDPADAADDDPTEVVYPEDPDADG